MSVGILRRNFHKMKQNLEIIVVQLVFVNVLLITSQISMLYKFNQAMSQKFITELRFFSLWLFQFHEFVYNFKST